MDLNLYSSIMINISLLVLIAIILTKIPLVKRIFSQEYASKLEDKLLLAVIFGFFCIFSTCTGVKVSGAIQNTRVLGALVGGLVGGPVVGIGAALIGAVHRFFYDVHGFTSVACTISTLFEGVIGSVIWLIYRKKNLKQTPVSLFLITAVAEVCQMLIILAVARPFSSSLALVKIIAAPMILCNSIGMVLFFSIFEEVFTKQDLLAADRIRLALNVADQCIPYIQKQKKTPEDYEKIAQIIRKDTKCSGVLILASDKKTIQNRTTLRVPEGLSQELDREDVIHYCIATKRSDPNYKELGKYVALSAKLTLESEDESYLILFLPRHVQSIQSELNFLEGLAKFFTTNYELSQIQYQKKLRTQAEFKALQSQINPHFLFNSLNTITYFCREKPEKARELLLALSVYFRHTLNGSNAYMIALEQEMEHVKAYLMLEEARFEERLQVVIDVPEDCQVQVPTLILQPIVENAVKHGAMKRERGMVKILAWKEERDMVIQVTDNGMGIPEQVLRAFYDKSTTGQYGLLNVDARLRSIYGESHGLKIDTSDQGTSVTMRVLL